MRSPEIKDAMNVELHIYTPEFHTHLSSDVDILFSSICYGMTTGDAAVMHFEIIIMTGITASHVCYSEILLLTTFIYFSCL